MQTVFPAIRLVNYLLYYETNCSLLFIQVCNDSYKILIFQIQSFYPLSIHSVSYQVLEYCVKHLCSVEMLGIVFVLIKTVHLSSYRLLYIQYMFTRNRSKIQYTRYEKHITAIDNSEWFIR